MEGNTPVEPLSRASQYEEAPSNFVPPGSRVGSSTLPRGTVYRPYPNPKALKTFAEYFLPGMIGSFSRYKFNEQKTLFQEHHMATALATHSNEGKIQRGLEHLGCAARNFVLIANTVGLTRFMEGLNGVPGRHFSDAAAQRMLESLGELYELQIDVDAMNGAHRDAANPRFRQCRIPSKGGKPARSDAWSDRSGEEALRNDSRHEHDRLAGKTCRQGAFPEYPSPAHQEVKWK